MIAAASHAQIATPLIIIMVVFIAGIAVLAAWYGRTR
jgi:hypothetical protein